MTIKHQLTSASEAVLHFQGLRVLVVGDAILDRYIEGSASRLCREAPVPVVVRDAEHRFAGGAANTAANLSAMGATVTFVSIVGDDANGEALRRTLIDARIDDRWIVTDSRAATLDKLRILGNDQYMVRIDDGNLATTSAEGRHALLCNVQQALPDVDVVILSDYGAGTVNDEVVGMIRDFRAHCPCPLAIDAKDITRYAHAGATLVSPNLEEARLAAFGHDDGSGIDVSEIARCLRAKLDATYIAITMAGAGVLLVDPDGHSTRLPTYPLPGSGDIGAGDSFVAATALALAAGVDARTAARIGIDAASIACTRRRTAVVTRRELLRRVSLSEETEPFADRSLKRIAAQIEGERAAGRRIVFTNGVFDILHAGHVQLLRRAKALGEVLVVGINSDASVRRLKGPRRPINREQDRLALISALDVVDYAFIFDDDSPVAAIHSLRPDIHVKGGDYSEESLPEIEADREVGAQVRILPLLDGRSTTNVIQRITDQATTGHPDTKPLRA